MKTAQMISLICLSSLIAAAPTIAGEKGGKGHKPGVESDDARGYDAQGKHSSERRGPREEGERNFSNEERRTIQMYVDRHGPQNRPGRKAKPLPPGLAKKLEREGSLPPGWQKKCVVGEVMPQEVYAQCHPLPPELVVKLPAPPELVITVAVGGKVVRLLKATREILDVFNVHVDL